MTSTRYIWKVVVNEEFLNCKYVYPIQQRKVLELINYLKQNENVKKIIIFGSSVTNKCHAMSDVDIYVELKENQTKLIKKYFDFAFDLWTNFTVDERLLNEILMKGVIVYEQ